MLLGCAVVGLTIYLTGWSLFKEQLFSVCPQAFILAQVKFINTTLIFRLLFVIPIIAVISLFLSHRIAGPIFRVERSLENMLEEKNLASRIKFRKKDELKELAEAINNVLDKATEVISRNKITFRNITNLLNELDRILLEESLDINKIKQTLKNLKAQIKESEECIAKFQL